MSLKAKSLAEPGAMERFHAANEDYERLVSVAERVVSGSFDELDRPRMAWVLETFEAEFLAADDAARVAGTVADLDSHDAADTGMTDMLEIGDVSYIRGIFQERAVALAARQGWVLDVESSAFSTLCLEMLRTEVSANRRRMERDRGHPVPTPIAPEPPPSIRPGARKVSSSFDSLVKEEMKRPTFTGGASTKQSWNTALRYLRELHGELGPEEFTRRHASDLADLLALAPVNQAIKESERGWPLPRRVEAYDGKDVRRLSWKARATIMAALQSAWNRCQRSGRISDDLPNPFARPNLGKAPPPRKNDGLTREESCHIFALRLFTAGERPSGGRGEASYWLPLLLFTTGARPEELAQALVADVRGGVESGEWSLTITAEGDHPHKGKRSLKTPSAERTIPLPSILLRLGFVDYVEWLKAHGELALFPAFRPKGERGELFARFGDWWSGYLRENGVQLHGKRPAREFRPTWATIARECAISREAQEYLMGHAPDASDMNARYGSREPLSREMHKLSFAGWGLEEVRAWSPPIE